MVLTIKSIAGFAADRISVSGIIIVIFSNLYKSIEFKYIIKNVFLNLQS